MSDHGDITDTLAPKSEQLDNIELKSGPRVFTVERVVVKKGAEQPVSVYLVDFPRPWRPGVNMRRVLAHYWGEKSALWVGRRVKLFRDPDVTYGKDSTGGTRIAAMSHIDHVSQPAPVLLSQGRSSVYTVQPLTDAPEEATEPTLEQIDACTDTETLRAMWHAAGPEMRDRITARVEQLREPDGPLIPSQSSAIEGQAE